LLTTGAAHAGGNNGNNGVGNQCQGNSCGSGGSGGAGGAGGNAQQAQGQAQGQLQGQAQGQLQGQAQGNFNAVGQGQALTNGNTLTNGNPSAQVGPQALSVNTTTNSVYLGNPYVQPLPTQDFSQTAIESISCPAGGLTGGIGYGGQGAGSSFGNANVSGYGASLGFLIPMGNGDCRRAQARAFQARTIREDLALIDSCRAVAERKVTLDPEVFPWVKRCEAVK
jgi:hypothetical protein